MALFKTKQAVKYEKKHLLGIQDLSIPEIVHILNESQSFVELNRKENKKLSRELLRIRGHFFNSKQLKFSTS